MEFRCFLFIVAYISVCYGRTLGGVLSHYDTLDKVDFQHRVYRRSFDQTHDRDISFVSHGKRFHMKLVQSKEIFDSAFRVVSVDRYGEETPIHINMDYFYKGYVEDDPTSHVTAHLEDDGLITATVETANETYFVEPMWRHVDKDPSHDHIVYKASDVKWNLTNSNDKKNGKAHLNTCGNNNTNIGDIIDDDDDNVKRVRRATSCAAKGGKNTCKLHLVADYSFCLNVGRKNPKTTTYYMLQTITRVNTIFRDTCWGSDVGKGFGVQVKKVTVYCDGYSTTPTYNADIGWNIDRLLTEFSRTDWTGYCLAHLFTYQDFANGVIGLAYVANKNSNYGGICSRKTRDRRSLRKHNCGFTSYVNWGRRLTTMEANIVTAHEIGHNFGSPHDGSQCAPGSRNGNYIMYASSVTGEKQNNKKFSTCSKSKIGGVLQRRKGWRSCLEEQGGARCGNGIVEGSEQCDEGSDGKNKCCKNCRFINGATCSDLHSLCCKECQTAPKDSKVCRASFTLGCEAAIKCDGKSLKCPKDGPKLTSGECIMSSFRKGLCDAGGSCASICGANSAPCSCDPGADSCKVCCRGAGGECVPHSSGRVEGDGVRCNITGGKNGLCDGGKCRQHKQDVKETFKNLLTDFSLDKAVQWMKNNIVITILFFSLLLWIPAGIIVGIIDRVEENKYKELEEAEKEDTFSRQNKRGSFKKKEKERGRAARGGNS